MKLNDEYHITKKGVIKENPNVMPYNLLMSINRAWEDIKNKRYTVEILKKEIKKWIFINLRRFGMELC